jgi:hypothetical protein
MLVLNLPNKMYVVRHDYKTINYHSSILYKKTQAFNNNFLHQIVYEQMFPLQNRSGKELRILIESNFLHNLTYDNCDLPVSAVFFLPLLVFLEARPLQGVVTCNCSADRARHCTNAELPTLLSLVTTPTTASPPIIIFFSLVGIPRSHTVARCYHLQL